MKFNFLYLFIILIGLNGCVTSKNMSSTTTNNNGTASTHNNCSSFATHNNRGADKSVIKQIGFKKDAYIKDAVKNECDLDGKLSQFVKENGAVHFKQISTNSESTHPNDQILTMEIEHIENGGRGWKGLRTSGTMVVVDGACSLLGSCVKTLGKDIADWLANPSQNAVLGDI